MKATRNFCYMKGEGPVDYNTVARWLKKFRSSCKNLDDQVRSSGLKTLDSEAVLEAIEANLISSIQRVTSNKLCILQFSVVCHLV